MTSKLLGVKLNHNVFVCDVMFSYSVFPMTTGLALYAQIVYVCSTTHAIKLNVR